MTGYLEISKVSAAISGQVVTNIQEASLPKNCQGYEGRPFTGILVFGQGSGTEVETNPPPTVFIHTEVTVPPKKQRNAAISISLCRVAPETRKEGSAYYTRIETNNANQNQRYSPRMRSLGNELSIQHQY